MKLFRLFPLLALVSALHAQPAAPAAPGTPSLTPVPTVIVSNHAEIWSNEAGTETYAHFTGNVIVTGTNLRITCDRLEVTAVGKNNRAGSTAQEIENFKFILATGKVHIVQNEESANREANCERAEVFPREEKIVLTGNPVVIDRGSGAVFTGEPMTLLKGERRVSGDNVKITFPPIKDLGFDKNAAAPKPEAAKP